MKRAVAIKKALKVAEILRSASGLIGTPGTDADAVRVKRAWLFGSTVKGKDEPNDVDILLEYEAVGRRYWCAKSRKHKLCGARLDKRGYRSYGYRHPVEAWVEARKFIKGGMTMVRLHNVEIDGNFGDIAETKVMIYPRNDFRA